MIWYNYTKIRQKLHINNPNKKIILICISQTNIFKNLEIIEYHFVYLIIIIFEIIPYYIDFSFHTKHSRIWIYYKAIP